MVLYLLQTQPCSLIFLLDGNGVPAARTGMSKSSFRGSDDAVTLPFNIPANAMAVVELRKVANMIDELSGSDQTDLVLSMRSLADEIEEAVEKFGKITHSVTGKVVYAYEVDGFGSAYFMDDANIPSLLSLPYLGYVNADDETYLNTREAVLSTRTNPFYFSGEAGEGVGGPHKGYGMVWPMAIAVRALTSLDRDEVMGCLKMLVKSSAGRGFIHESFWKDNVTQFTRPWFAWANSLFSEVITMIIDEHPSIILLSDKNFTQTVQR